MGRAGMREPVDLGKALLAAWATNERMNQYLLEHLPAEAWRAGPPEGKGRTIAAIVSHIHNVRHMWLAVSGKGKENPAKLDRLKVTIPEARAALAMSSGAIAALLADSMAAGGHVKDFKPDVAGFFTYAVSHEAHHRGQICLLARHVGFQLPEQVGFGMWDWKKRWQETS